jgi:hypothetical protein
MHAVATPSVSCDSAAILDRHAVRRSSWIPTATVLVGPAGAAVRVWRRWVVASHRSVVVAEQREFPTFEWIQRVAENSDLPRAAVHNLARRLDRDPDDFLAAWFAKTAADRESCWNCVPPNQYDDLLRTLANLVDQPDATRTIAALNEFPDRAVPLIAHLTVATALPTVIFNATSATDLALIADSAAKRVFRIPSLAVAITAAIDVWHEYSQIAPESRTKALLREGELRVENADLAAIEKKLHDSGIVASTAAAIAECGADATLVELAVTAAKAAASPPTTALEDDRARSAAERFLFEFLESLPETAGKFELNATVPFRFGSRLAEIDLLCRSPQIAIELDGYFHFQEAAAYRRDRAKDWELQRRGYLVLRFLSEDVIRDLDVIRDRILEAFHSGDSIGARL